MDNNKIKDYIKQVHETAVNNGWWETKCSFATSVSLFHSELSEALEEYRANRPLVWYEHNEEYGEKAISTDLTKWNGEKLEGAYTELVDCVIRVMDYMGASTIDLYYAKALPESYKELDLKDLDLPIMLAICHMIISKAFECSLEPNSKNLTSISMYLSGLINFVILYIEKNGYDFEQILTIKDKYNTTRGYRHGGKKC